jgi:hypothetical protein
MFRYFTHVGNYKWVKVLPDLVSSYNLATHRSLPKGMTPTQATELRNHSQVWNHQESISISPRHSVIINIGDKVRISKWKGTFEKGYLANFSEEIFTVNGMDTRHQPTMYTIIDEQGEQIEGNFYTPELQAVKLTEWYAVEKVI